MSQPFVGEIRMFAGNFAPAGWMFCDGQLLPINEFDTLFNLIGTTYGGDGQSTFALPDLRGRLPVHVGPGFVQAQQGGVEQVTLTVPQMPAHSHPMVATTNNGNNNNPSGLVLGGQPSVALYFAAAGSDVLDPRTIGTTGGSQPHNNFQPYLCVDFIISLFGIFPSQT
jgi:microcystin-dependent protein